MRVLKMKSIAGSIVTALDTPFMIRLQTPAPADDKKLMQLDLGRKVQVRSAALKSAKSLKGNTIQCDPGKSRSFSSCSTILPKRPAIEV
jgi:hypothetical protein